MSRKYEALLVLNVEGKEENVETMVSSIGQEMEGEGARLDQIDHLGKKTFPYNARNLAAGYYVNIQFEAEPDAIAKVKTKMDLNKDIHLQHYQKVG